MAFLDSNTLEVVDNIIEIDDRMVPIIQELNKKGYKTEYCCSGHESLDRIQFNKLIVPKNRYEMVKGMIADDIIDLGEYDGRVVIANIGAWQDIYIAFDKIYDFDVLPEGFEKEISKTEVNGVYREVCSIRKIIMMYKDEDNKIFKTTEELASELDQANERFLAWAKSLKPLDEMKLKREK